MELFGELFLTASLALFLSFLVAKLVAVALAGGDSNSKSTARVSDQVFVDELRVQSSETESEVKFVDEALEKVDHFREEVAAESERREEQIPEEKSEIVGLSREAFNEISVDSAKNDVVSPVPQEVRASGGEPEGKEEASEVDSRPIVGDEDDWEGIERDELRSDFEAAVKFVEGRAGDEDPPANVFGSDVQMALYGLRKVATEGTCHEPLHPALDLSDRAKWNAWQKLGNMTPEMAMEQYITILSENAPGWMDDHLAEEIEQEHSEEKADRTAAPALSTNEREPELKSCADRVDSPEASNSDDKETKHFRPQDDSKALLLDLPDL